MKEIKFRDLKPEEIEVRVGTTSKNEQGKITAFNLLLYKTARVDTTILDETFGIFGWKNNYYQVKNTMICSVSIWDEDKKEWINKDNGGDDDFTVEQVKAECSDSMKRCCFNLGIGKKLYSASKIYMRVDKDKYQSTERDYFKVDEIEYDETSITKLVISNKKTHEVVISYGTRQNNSQTSQKAPQKQGGKVEEITQGIGDSFLEDSEPIRQEDKEWLQQHVSKFSGEQMENFKVWLNKNCGTTSIGGLSASQGSAVVKALKRK